MIFLHRIYTEKPMPKDAYFTEIPAIRHVLEKGLEFHRPVTFFIGENGSGKSTLLEAIAAVMGFNPEGGSRQHTFSTHDTHSELWNCLKSARSLPPRDGFFLRAESFYNVASYLEDAARLVGASLPRFHFESHGESFLELVKTRFENRGLYLLDEPEAALSPNRLLTLLTEIRDLVQNRESQLIIATHSPILMAFPDAELLLFSDKGISPIDYRETEHFQITKAFLNSPEKMLRILFSENDAE